MVERSSPEILWPDWFDRSEELIYKDKGYFEAKVRIDDQVIGVSFYDPVRLAQDIASELEAGATPVFHNLIVVSEISRQAMQMALERSAKELQ